MVYKSCGFFGFGKTEATEADFRASGYEPSQFKTSCGFLGFGSKDATLYAIPEAWRDNCTPLSGSKNGTYEVTSAGACSLQSCKAGAIRANGRCVEPGTSCTPSDPQPHASYTYASTGECSLSACGVGTTKRPPFSVSDTAGKCSTGYTAIADASACRAAASRFGLSYSSTVSEPGLIGGCVVHSVNGSNTVSFNSNASGVASTADQFALCGRGNKDPCAVVGEVCGTQSNYTWNSKGYCQGSCSGGASCAPGDRCCSGVCTPLTQKCAIAKQLDDEAKSMGSKINAIAGSMKELTSSFSQLKA